ncbi:hypothetical protein H257_17397 [Aphanomyces astaci]|uniref:BTB domain-containing protein n=1 Tax=Aphanomyces astaci TaxID=112090 RepID=W4FH55_APHAT|nr:hypothetical protein H257_17397 [Aphanomyces astaci]ETV66068.1 hypothetical protein H257_17397 [Aphanomyces astaci]|eukprot:XP_009844497.1 hypothetical protein H257_17397 [Aphanomyces astaci]
MDGCQEFLYTGCIQVLTVDTALELLGVADHYALQDLSTLCDNFLAYKLDTETVCHVLIAATHFQVSGHVEDHVHVLPASSFHQVVSTKGFEELGEFPAALLLEVTRVSMLSSHKHHKIGSITLQ